MEQQPMEFESRFDIDKVSFDHVSRDFEEKFRENYRKSLKLMSDGRDRFMNNQGANSLGILEKMAQHIKDYDKSSNFEESYHQVMKEFQPFTET